MSVCLLIYAIPIYIFFSVIVRFIYIFRDIKLLIKKYVVGIYKYGENNVDLAWLFEEKLHYRRRFGAMLQISWAKSLLSAISL